MRGLEERDAMCGLVERGAMRGVGDSEWLEDSGVQGTCPFSHHRICTHICREHLEGAGGADPPHTGKACPATVESERHSGAQNSL